MLYIANNGPCLFLGCLYFITHLIIHVILAGFLLIGTILDIGVWYHVKDLKIYDASDGDEKPAREPQ